MNDHLYVWERGTDMVLAAHSTQVSWRRERGRDGHFERPDHRINFRLVRGPVPHVRESFVLEVTDGGTTLTWEGELGTDFAELGALWHARHVLPRLRAKDAHVLKAAVAAAAAGAQDAKAMCVYSPRRCKSTRDSFCSRFARAMYERRGRGTR